MYILDKEQKRNMVFIFFVILFGAGLETLGVSIMLPFIQMLITPEELMEKEYVKFFAGLLGIQEVKEVTFLAGIMIIVVYLIKNIGLIISGYLQTQYSMGLVKKLSYQMMDSYMNRPYQFFVDGNSGEIIRGATGDVADIRWIILNMFKFISEVFVVLCIGTYVIMVDPIMAFGILAICAVCFVSIVYALKKKMSRLGILARDAMVESNQMIIQIFYGIKDIFVRQKRNMFLNKYDIANEKTYRANTWNVFAGLLPERIIETMCISGIIAVVLARIMMGVDNAKFIPVLAVFAVAAFRVLPSISRITGYASQFIFQRPALQAAYENIKAGREYMASSRRTSRDEELENTELHFKGTLEVRNLSWRYNEKNGNVLTDLSLSVSKGEAIGIIGESGSGKSTLCDILLGLYRPQQGTVTVDRYSVFDIPHVWSKMMGYVPQMVYLLDDTIRSNVAFGEAAVRDEDVWNALEQSSLKNFVESLPKGLDTIVGERGIKFSGGQRQRIAIARALYNKPDILILDEATSALDNETEAAVMEAIESLQGSITMIIIAHRLTTLRSCDRIYKIENGSAEEIEKANLLL